MKSLLFLAVLYLVCSLGVSSAAERFLVREAEDGDCCDARLEITGNGEAYYLENQELAAATVEEANGVLHVEVDGKTRWMLTPQDGAWTDQRNGRWVSRETLVKNNPEWSKVRIRVTDQDGKSLGAFGFTYQIDSKDGRWDPLLVKPLPTEDGQIEIKAPEDCFIQLVIEHPDFVRGFNSPREVQRKSGATELKVQFERGQTVSGKLVDDESGKGLADVLVSPLIFTPPLFSPDWARTVKTAADGSFTLRGVAGMLAAQHSDYLEEEVYLKDGETTVTVKLKKGLTMQGKVSDPSGKPLADVVVDDGSGKRTRTGEDGRFTLLGLRKWSDDKWAIKFFKAGFNDHRYEEAEAAADGLDVTLTPLPQLRGRVVRADGKPVGTFTAVCGPGPNPSDYECVESTVEGVDGRFVFQPRALPDEGTDYWLGIRAVGAAPWEGVVSQATLEVGDFQVVLSPGFSLSGRLVIPEAAGELEIRIEPSDREPQDSYSSDLPGKPLATQVIRANRGDPLRIFNLRTGEYQLRIIAKGATPLLLPVKIGGEDVDLGELTLHGTGSITGIANEPYTPDKAWRFADGKIFVDGFGAKSHEPFMSFKTDGDGRFHVNGVPVGKVSVMFDYHESADIINSVVRTVVVKEGKVTETRFEGEGGGWSQPLRFLFDNKEAIPVYQGARIVDNVTDREPMLRIDVLDVDGITANSVEWSPDHDSPPAISDLAPGRWKIRISDWLGSRGFDEGLRAETIAEIGEKRVPITIGLGSRILSGRVTSARETKRLIQLIAVGRSSGRVFHSRADDEGDFVIRYLPEDDYFVHARDDDGGWCDLGTRKADKPSVDFGEHALGDGGHVTGRIEREILSAQGDFRLSAQSTDGIVVPVDELENDGTYRFGHLKPGKWTIVGQAADREFLRRTVPVERGATVDMTLTEKQIGTDK